MTIICSLLFTAMLITVIISIIQQNKIQLIGALLLSFIALMLLLFRYKIVLFDDMMMIYEWKMFAMLPSVIYYNDIQEISIKNKHCVMISHKKKNYIYVFDAQKFIDTYKELNKK